MSEAGFTRLESERLILRRFKASDLAPFLAYRNDPEVARYQTWDSYTEREAAAMIEELGSLQPGTPGEWFQFAIELKKTGALIGDCALKAEEDGRQAEVGFTLSREHQGKGYAELQEVRSEWVMTGCIEKPGIPRPRHHREALWLIMAAVREAT